MLPTYYLSHGGGPWPWMPNVAPAYATLAASLKDMRTELGEAPRAALVVTAHWETEDFAFSTAERPGMIYDYYGFPPETYEIVYPAPGMPSLAEKAAGLLRAGGMKADLDAERGFDHGTFSLMKGIYPDADMPIVQMSIGKDYDPVRHIEAGKLLAPLREEGIVIIGSGLSFHNLRAMGPLGRDASRDFDGWLQNALLGANGNKRAEAIIDWERAPAARQVHPREDHLMPLHVAVGAAMEEAAHVTYHQDDFFGAITASSSRFGDAPAPQAAAA